MIQLKRTREIVIVFFLAAVIFFAYSDAIVSWINSLNPFLIIVVSSLLNPVYLIFIWGLYKTYGIRGMMAGFLMATASDIISLPHFYLLNGQQATGSINLLSESTFRTILPQYFNTTVNLPMIGATNLMVLMIYVVVSTALVLLGLMVAHKRSAKQIFMKSI